MAPFKYLAEQNARRAHFGAPGPSKVSKGKERASGHHRPPPTQKELERKKARREKIKVLKSRSYIYVGNLSSSVTEEDLEKLFLACGPVGRVSIRRTSHYINEDEETPGESSACGNDSRYATVEFYNPQTSREAIQLTGTDMGGCRIIVVLTPSDLPEVKRMRERHIELRENGGNIFKTGIPLQPTLVLQGPHSYTTMSDDENVGPDGRHNLALISSSNKVRYHRVRK